MGAVRRVVAVVLAGSLLVGPLVVGPGLAQTDPQTDNTVTRIEVRADGSAKWTVRIRTRLETDAEAATYRAFQRQFRNDTGRYLNPFRDRIRAVVAGAANATGREMRAVNFTASTSIQQVPRRWGVVTYSFTWTGFAAEEGDRLVVGDVFEGGLLITENDTLEIKSPPGYGVAAVDPDPTRRDDGTLTWVGRVDFADGRPRVAFAPERARTTQPQTSGNEADSDTGNDAGGDGGVALAVVGVGLAVAVGGALVALRRSGKAGSDSPGATSAAGTDTENEAELLSDEERVLRLLEAEGARMRQSAIAERLDWSASKTSRVVSRLSEDGDVEKMRLGRENVVTLSDE